ncbi:hypothetical protein [Gordonia polyisoprenivorans]|uniref:hypothetical protein n=1 Tax=Gordonia polyisoprenivorans TaxID=84595 RepID=UPI0005BE4BB5|nr:hypothetical protein [Gordonia polyisoprenivorans]
MCEFALFDTPQRSPVLATTMIAVLHLATTTGSPISSAQAAPGTYTSSDLARRLRWVRDIDEKHSTAAQLLNFAADGDLQAIAAISRVLMSAPVTGDRRSTAAKHPSGPTPINPLIVERGQIKRHTSMQRRQFNLTDYSWT